MQVLLAPNGERQGWTIGRRKGEARSRTLHDDIEAVMPGENGAAISCQGSQTAVHGQDEDVQPDL